MCGDMNISPHYHGNNVLGSDLIQWDSMKELNASAYNEGHDC